MTDDPVKPMPGTAASQMADESQASLVSTRDELDSVNTKGIKLSQSARDNILMGINDSSESLSSYGDNQEDAPTTGAARATSQAAYTDPLSSTSEAPAFAPIGSAASGINQPKRTSRFFGGGDKGGSSKLAQVMDSADMETPKAEKGDPLAKKGAQLAVPGNQDSLSRAATQEDDKSDALSGGSSSQPQRPGAMRRLTSRIKRTISSKG